MKDLYIISEDGITQYRNNGGCFERKALYNDQKNWEGVSGINSLEELVNESKKDGFLVAYSLKSALEI